MTGKKIILILDDEQLTLLVHLYSRALLIEVAMYPDLHGLGISDLGRRPDVHDIADAVTRRARAMQAHIAANGLTADIVAKSPVWKRVARSLGVQRSSIKHYAAAMRRRKGKVELRDYSI